MDYDYEFTFVKVFDQFLYDQCTIPETDNDGRKQVVQNTTLLISDVLNNMPGINVFSSFCQFNGKNYKVTVSNN